MITKPNKVLILGSSALKIGEAGEFDYSGSQAIKALKEENIKTVLVNPNIATIQTSENLADEVYFLPVTPYFVEQVIKKERPDGILLGFGGQTALNCGVALDRDGVLRRYGVTVLGTPVEAIMNTEDRDLFTTKLKQIDVKTPRSQAVTSMSAALQVADDIGYPVMVRIAYALGGLGSGICRTPEELQERAEKAFAYTSQILVEEYLLGWKEVEYEIVRDQYDNCLSVCNMENFDPMGIHTGESIVVAPSQTLTNREYHMLREIAIRTVRHLGIVGECNIQYALDANSEDYRVIEINARLSRSSALASKATGYPLAFVAAKLSLGHCLTDLPNSITRVTKSSFEPALDYIVVKIPRWDLKKFRLVSKKLGSGMKSVGEIMAIGRKFEEALQKGIRMLETGFDGLVLNRDMEVTDLRQELVEPTDMRALAIPQALKSGMSVDEIHELTHIDKWFLYKIKNIVEMEQRLKTVGEQRCPRDIMQEAKQLGFADKQIARALDKNEMEVRELRKSYGLSPCVKQIDTLAAEYPAQTNYLYLTYNGNEDDLTFTERNSVMVLGGGAYRIGSSVEFDWCCVNSVQALKNLSYTSIMVNYNPETVSTDYDQCDKLYFDELSFESVVDIYEKEKPIGVIISMGGQIPNNLALKLHNFGVRVLGTSPLSIDSAEDRHKFSKLLDTLHIDQPAWAELSDMKKAIIFANDVGYPVLIRPSYVLSGAAMSVASNDTELEKYLNKASVISADHPVVITKFIEDAKEIEIDAVAQKGEIRVYAITEHVENAGVHSGDATMVLPPQRTFLETTRRVKKIAREIANALKIDGPFNIQFVAKENEVKVIECNLRASRSFPFVSKIFGVNFIDIATRVIMGHHVPHYAGSVFDLEFVGVKAPQFSFTRLGGADPTLGVEMASTGEVACLGDDFEEAFLKSLLSVGYKLPVKNILLSTGPIATKAGFLASTRKLEEMGMNFYATGGTARFMEENGIKVKQLHWPLTGKSPNVLDYLRERKVDLVINIPKNYQEEELTNDYIIRRAAVDFAIPLFTNMRLARRFVEAISRKSIKDLQIKSWSEYR
jgi:carbamoyl-phosphate synthase large subunit